jgi:hypothetical protein
MKAGENESAKPALPDQSAAAAFPARPDRSRAGSNITGRGAVVVLRPGALDFRKHPSRLGDQLVPYWAQGRGEA